MENIFGEVNRITLCRNDWDSDEEFTKKIGETLQLLFKCGYICVVMDDDGSGSVIVIEYQHDERLDAFGVYNPMWVSPEEEEMITVKRLDNSEENKED